MTTNGSETMQPTTIAVPDTKELEKRSGSIIADIENLVVKNQESHGRALTLWGEADTVDKAIVEKFEEPTSAANKVHKFLTGLREMFRGPLIEAKSSAQKKATDWADAERRRAEEEARKLAEKARREHEERQLALAIEAEAQGDKAAAEAIIETRAEAPYIPPKPNLAKVDDVGERGNYSGQVVDLLKLVKYVAANPREVNLLTQNQTAINQRARSMRREGEILPGVVGVKKTGLVRRA